VHSDEYVKRKPSAYTVAQVTRGVAAVPEAARCSCSMSMGALDKMRSADALELVEDHRNGWP